MRGWKRVTHLLLCQRATSFSSCSRGNLNRRQIVESNFAPQIMIAVSQAETFRAEAEYHLGYVWLISVVAAMGGLLFGWDRLVVGGAKPFDAGVYSVVVTSAVGTVANLTS